MKLVLIERHGEWYAEAQWEAGEPAAIPASFPAQIERGVNRISEYSTVASATVWGEEIDMAIGAYGLSRGLAGSQNVQFTPPKAGIAWAVEVCRASDEAGAEAAKEAARQKSWREEEAAVGIFLFGMGEDD